MLFNLLVSLRFGFRSLVLLLAPVCIFLLACWIFNIFSARLESSCNECSRLRSSVQQSFSSLLLCPNSVVTFSCASAQFCAVFVTDSALCDAATGRLGVAGVGFFYRCASYSESEFTFDFVVTLESGFRICFLVVASAIEYNIPAANSGIDGITLGSDGNL